MKICYFGMYAANYSRNHILIKGLRQNDVTVIECNVRRHFVWGFRYYHLVKKFLQVGKEADIIFVGFPGQTDVPLAWLLGKIFHKKVVFDAFISLYNSMVYDRKYFGKNSIRAKIWWFIDWQSCILADKIILDTNEHIEYFVKTFKIIKEKFSRVFVGTDTEIFYPRKVKSHTDFQIGFHGSYLPLQGVDIIIESARILKNNKDIKFNLLGDGLDRKKIELLINKYHLNNIRLLDPVPYESLSNFISSNDIYLGGHYGVNEKSGLVIANKVFESLASGVATIIGESPATRELFTDGKNCIFVRQEDPKDLAEAILKLKKNISLREKIANGGYNLIINRLTPRRVVDDLIYELWHIRRSPK